MASDRRSDRSAGKDATPAGGKRLNTGTSGPKMDSVGSGGNVRDRTQHQGNREERSAHHDGDSMDWLGGNTTERKGS